MDQFKDYLGKKIGVKETEHEYKSDYTGRVTKYTECKVDEDESTIAAIKKEWGDYIRVWVPGMMGTCDWQPTRLNIHIEKNADGDYTITEIKTG